MHCKTLFSWSFVSSLLVVCSFLACTPSSKKSEPTPVVPVSPGTPTPQPSVTPTPTPTPTPNVPAGMIGDWQSQYSESKYKGNVTYSLDKSGGLKISLLIYSKGQNTIMAERQEWKGTLDKNGKYTGTLVHSSCPAASTTQVMYFSQYGATDVIHIGSSQYANNSLDLGRVKGGLTVDVHATLDIQEFEVVEGCFPDGRLDQFVPTAAVKGSSL